MMFLPALPRVMGMLHGTHIRINFKPKRVHLPAAQIAGIPCPMFPRGVARRIAQAGYHLCDCIASSSRVAEAMARQSQRDSTHAYDVSKTSSKMP